MRLKLTLARQSGQSDDIVVTTDAVAKVADVADAIRRLDPRGQEWVAGGPDRVLTLAVAMPGQAEPAVLSPEAPIGEAQIGDGATVLLTDAEVRDRARRSAANREVARLRVRNGPAAGTEHRITQGSMTIIGRDPGCDLVLDDPFVSGRHARLQAMNGLELVDMGSANGLMVDGGLVDRVPIRGPLTVLVGDTELEVIPEPERPASAVPEAPATKPGPVLFNRSPKVEGRYVGAEFQVPEVPQEAENQPMPIIALVTPLLMGGAMYMLTRNPTSLLFVLMSPLMVVGNWFMGRGQRKSRLKNQIARFEEGLAALTDAMAREREKEAAQRLRETPSTEEAYEAGVRRTRMLWTRRPEHWSFLNVRLGVGAMPSRNTIDIQSRPNLLVEFQDRLDAVIEQNRTVPGVPITENLFDAGAIGIAGPPRFAAGSLNSVLVQLTALHSPAELVVSAIVSSGWSHEVEWLKWLPHTSSPHSPLEGGHLADSESSAGALLSRLEGLVQQRLAEQRGAAERRGAITQGEAALERGATVGTAGSADDGTRSPIPAVVLLVSDDAPVDRGRLIQLAEAAADAGVFPIWVAPDVPALPAVCRTFLAFDEDGAAQAGFVRLGEAIENVAVETVDGDRARAFAHLLAPVVDAGAPVADSSDLPRSISLVTLLGHDLAEKSDAVVDRWRQNDSIHDRSGGALTPRRAGRLRAIIGSAGHDPMHLDLRTQGPHALVGGTTGAGKSEFLQAWVLGMAAEYSPDRVTFLFVDYKGGSAFADCVNLPHCVGLVTDLSPHLVRRALTSLRAELRYREHLFNRKKAKDLLELEKRGDPDSPPALVLVIDEFAALVGEVPEFVDGVVDIAQRGRSLGIHLIMATQRPAGVIKDNLRANTNLRVALRMADESDSSDVVGVKDAAHIDPSLPGRGYAKTGPGRLAAFQSGYAGGWTTREPEQADIQVAELRFGGELRWEDRRAPAVVESRRDPGPNDQQRLVTTMRGAHALAGIPEPRRPWLDELAPVYDLSRLRQRTDAELLLGVADVPEQQQQLPVYFRPDVDGHLAIFGTGGSGKSTVLRTLASAAAITPRGGPVQVYGLDYGAGSLRILERLPHVGAIIPGEDVERIVRLFRMLARELEQRAADWAEVNASSVTEYRQLSGDQGRARILVLIDGFTSFKEDFEVTAGRSQWYDVFRDVLADGRRLGIDIALTADRAGAVPTSIAAAIQRRVVLRLADDGYGALGVPGDVLGPDSPPGRAIVDGFETQIAILGGSTSVSEQSEALGRLAEAMTRAGVPPAPEIGSLPKEYPQSELPDAVGGLPVLGIGDLDLGPYPFDPAGTLLLAGPPASGRSTALQTMAQALVRADPETRLYYCGNARSPLGRLEVWTDTATTPDEVAALARDLAAAVADPDTEGRIAVFVETIGDFLQTPADGPLVELVKQVRRSDHLLVAEGETSAWGSSWPLFGEVKNGRRGILLQPDAVEGDILLKTPLPRMNRNEFPPGRAVYIAKGQHARVQLPLPG